VIYTYPEAADRLRVKESWLRRHISRLPHSKKGRVVTFTESDIEAIEAMHHVTPWQPTAAAGGVAVLDLKPLPSRRSA
jgi:hypothetical protein